MYTLIGALFLTKVEGDIGFPVFQLPRDNLVYTCLLHENLEIIKFLPVYTEQFYFEQLLPRGGVFNLGDRFSLMMFRRQGGIEIVDLSQETEAENLLEAHPNEPFRNLQIARYLSSQHERYRSKAVTAISEAARSFSLDQESRLSFISLETSLLSRPEWDFETEQVQENLVDDDIYRGFYEYGKEELSQMLREEPFLGTLWPYIYLTYDQRFGMDEYLYILGKRYLAVFLAHGREPITRVMSQVIRTLAESHRTNDIAITTVPDRELKEALEDLLYSQLFIPLCQLYPPLARLILNFLHAGNDDAAEAAREFCLFLESREEVLPDLSRRDLVTELKRLVREFQTSDFKEFAIWFLSLDEETSEEHHKLLSNKEHLSAAVYGQIERWYRDDAEGT